MRRREKHKIRSLAAMLGLSLLMTAGLTVTGTAAGEKETVSAAGVESWDDLTNDLSFWYDFMTLNERTVDALESTSMSGSATQVTIYMYGLNNSDTSSLRSAYPYCCPYLSATSQTVDDAICNSASDGGTRIWLVSKISSDELDDYIASMEQAAARIEGSITTDMTDLQKAMTVHDYIVAHYKYQDVVNDNTANYGAMLHFGATVCNGYAHAYAYIMNRIGIPAVVVSSESMDHAWTMIKIDGNWYHVDPTFDDPKTDRFGQAQHGYFLLSDAAVQTTGTNRYEVHTGWTGSTFSNGTTYTCTDTSYDEAWWQSVTSSIVWEDNYAYYVDGYYLNKRDMATGEVTQLVNLGLWYTSSGAWYGQAYSGLFENSGKLYFNTASDIRSYDLSSGAVSVVYTPDTSSKSIYGCRDNGTSIEYVLQTGATETYTSVNTIENVLSGQQYISLSKETLTLYEGQQGTISASCFPADSGESYTWASSNPSVAVCSNGKITGLKEGYTVIICTSSEGKQARCYVHVKSETHHAWGPGQVEVQADCTHAGKVTYTCTLCGQTMTEEVPAYGHCYSSYTVTKEATCTEDGLETSTCSFCGDTRTKVIEKTGHDYETVSETDATCTETGTRTSECSKCGDTKTETIPALGHKWTYWTKSRATCEEDGYIKYYCANSSVNGCEAEKTVVLPKTAHQWSGWVKLAAATYTTPSTYVRTCWDCSQENFYYGSKKSMPAGVLKSVSTKAAGVYVTWNAAENASGYIVYRKVTGGSYSRLTTVGSSVTAYYDKTAVNGTSYTYCIRVAYTDSYGTGYSAISNEKTCLYLSYPALSSVKNSAAGKITVTWKQNAKATGYQIVYSYSSDFSGQKVVAVTSPSTVSKVISGMTKGKTVYVKVRAYKKSGTSTWYSAYSSTVSLKITQ